MKNLLRRILPQGVINIFKHLPIAVLANLGYGFPSRKLTVIGVTGTDGKTTTVNMIYRILKEAGKSVSMVSTINAVVGGEVIDTGFHVTSPDPLAVQRFLREAVKNGDEYVVLEVTSHALDQFRFWGVRFDIGVITNITHEHLDYHKTFKNYFNTKVKLIKNVRVAVINRDEKHFSDLAKKTGGKVVSFGSTKNANFNPVTFPLKLKLPGQFNVLNALAAAVVGVNLKIPSKVIKRALENVEKIEGRMMEIENDKGFKIVIDFAHTPNALENALSVLRKDTKGKLIAVFGSAGFRDVDKRGLMGEVSAKMADVSVITAEDPRGLIERINQQILEGAQKQGGVLRKNVFVEADRQKAIDLAIKKIAKPGDTVGIFGKGHERSLNMDGKTEMAWGDEEAVEKALNE